MTNSNNSTLRLPIAPVADQRLLDLLKRSGRIDAKTASAVERVTATRRQSVIEAVVAAGSLSEEDIARTIAAELKLPFVDLRSAPCDDSGVAVLNRSLALHYGLVPVRTRQNVLIVAMANPLDEEALRAIESAVGFKLQPTVASASQVLETLRRLYKGESSLAALLADVPEPGGLQIVREAATDVGPADAAAITREAEQAPIIKMVNLILFEAFKARASDVHIEPGPNLVLVRFRIDGVLEDHLQIPKWVQGPIVARIKVMAKLDITERRVPQDGKLSVRIREDLVDVRVSSMPTTDGEKIVLRLLDPSNGPRRLDEIGLSDRDLATLQQVIQQPEGMILVTGPTGSGKTTTLYAMIQELLSPELNIVTIENPVEYQLKGAAQVSINEKQGLTFAQVLRSTLRQDPDVILVGEIRDRETAEIAFQAAQTGHLVFSTVHTNDSAATVTRLLDLGIEPQLMAPSLLAVVAQRLVRKVCDACAEPADIDEETRVTLGIRRGQPLRRGRGCPACRNTGFRGRTGCYEVLKVSRAMEQLIDQKSAESAMRTLAQDEGMTTILEDARTKVVAGLTTPAEVLRVIEVENRSPSCPSCRKTIEASFTACPFCRSPLRSSCGGCGAALKKDWEICPFCGVETNPPAAAARGEPRPGGPVRRDVEPRPAAEPAHRLSAFEAPRILVVDDAADVLDLVRRTLLKSHPAPHVDVAGSGEEGLAKIKARRPHLVILDLMMPGIDGHEVCRRLRADLSTALIPIIMLTACIDDESKIQGFLAGTDDYVVKPFSGAELRARVQRLLQRTYDWAPAEQGTAAPEKQARAANV